MKKIIASFAAFCLLFSAPMVFAKMPIPMPAIMAPSGLERIGVVAAIQGKVEVMTLGAAGRVVQSGEEIFTGDEVKTDAQGHLQILLLDETVFTIGPNSAIMIDKFIYDPKTHAGNVEASITKGVFRYVSGKIASQKPENVTIHLPTATIGIRGTIIAGEASATGSMAMLLGPGSQNDAKATIGSFVMNGTGENSGQQEHVNRTGFGVSVDQAGSVSGVFQVPAAQVNHLSTALLPGARQSPGPVGGGNDQGAPPNGRAPNQGPSGAQPSNGTMPGAMPGAPAPGSGPAPIGPAPMAAGSYFNAGANMGQISGERMVMGFDTTKQFNMMGMLQNGLLQDTTQVAQDAAQNNANQNTATHVASLTTYGNMNSVTRASGPAVYHFSELNGVLSGVNNTFTFFINIDFPDTSDASSRVAGGNSRVEVNLNGNLLKYSLGQDVWVPGENPFNFSGVSDSDGTPDAYLKADIKVAIENAAVPAGNLLADIAAQANVTVTIKDISSVPVIVASGDAVSDARDPGLTT